MLRPILLALATLALSAPAGAQSIDGTWLMFDDPDDPALARIQAQGARLPQEEIEAHKRIEFSGEEARAHVDEATISLTIVPEPTEWGVDASISAIEGSQAPITFLRIEIGDGDAGTLTSYSGQTPLESFAILRVRPE